MHVIILGAGLIGVTSAWYLRQAGHTVTLVDRQPAPGLETSYANGGQLSASHPEPWANPGAPAQILRWLGREDAPLLFRPRLDWQQWSWGLRFLFECLPRRTTRNTAHIARLAVYSRHCLAALRTGTGIEYERLDKGILHLFFTPHEFAQAAPRARLLREFGMRADVLGACACVDLEPALARAKAPFQGGLHAPDDETGDAFKFTQNLARFCQESGANFSFTQAIESFRCRGNRIDGVWVKDEKAGRQLLQGDAYLLAAGSYSPLLARTAGENLPVYPVKGYSVTLPLADDTPAPCVSITDESRRIVYSRLGNRLRIAGTAELTGYAPQINRARCEAILKRAHALFPQLDATDAAANTAQYWAGLRPATPGNVPIIGRSRFSNLFYNTGHGTLGWTLACGSGQIIADLIDGKPPAIDFPVWRL